jgi:nitrogen fixation protein FixH
MSAIKLWPAGIFALLGLNVAIVATTVVFATTSDSTIVEAHPYERGLQWDQEQQKRTRSDELHWTCSASIVAPSTQASAAIVRVAFTDATGQPVTGLGVQIIAFHHAHSAQRVALEAIADPSVPGSYVATLKVPEKAPTTHLPLGLWRLSVSAILPRAQGAPGVFARDCDTMLTIHPDSQP